MRKKRITHGSMHTICISVKHNTHGHIWLLMNLGHWVIIDDVTTDKSSRMNSEVYKAVLSAHIQSNVGGKIRLSALQCRWLMIQNILQKQPKSLLKYRNGRFLNSEVPIAFHLLITKSWC